MALRFSKKKPDDDDAGDSGKEAPAFQAQPEKARGWFEHGRKAADPDYALTCFANGIRLDPSPMSAHEAMFAAAVKYTGKPAAGKDVRKIDGPHPVEKFAAAEFAWMKDLNSASLALKFLEASVKAREWVAEVGRWHCPRVLGILRRQKKPSKAMFLNAKDLFPELGAWDEALAAGVDALRLDPDDAKLENELKDISAQRAMDQGRYEEAAGEEGGFRKFVKDPEKQRELGDSESISAGLDVAGRNLERARREYEESPSVPDVINVYAQLLRALATPESLEQSFAIFMKGYEETGQYRFRASAGDIRISEARAKMARLQEKLDEPGANSEIKGELDAARDTLLELRHTEYAERIKEYPTDRVLKQQFGEVIFDLGRYDDAMPCFQEAKDDPRLRVRAGYMLGRCFAAQSWHDEAIGEFKEALERVEPGDKETELSVRYDLMVSLMGFARDTKSLEIAREALDICSSIVRKDITYRDIRSCRKQADELIKELTGPASSED